MSTKNRKKTNGHRYGTVGVQKPVKTVAEVKTPVQPELNDEEFRARVEEYQQKVRQQQAEDERRERESLEPLYCDDDDDLSISIWERIGCALLFIMGGVCVTLGIVKLLSYFI